MSNASEDLHETLSLDEAMDIPGAPGMQAPSATDHKEWTAWLSATALPQVRPMRMPQQRFDYWRLERPRTLAIGSDATPEGAAG